MARTPTIHYHVKSLEYNKEVRLLKDFVLQQPQWYPLFKEWVDGKFIPRIESEEYVPLLLFDKKSLAGNLTYRQLDKGIIEIKNLRIDEQYHNHYWGKILLQQLKILTKGNEIITDVTEHNRPALDFFLRNGFSITGKEALYLPNQYEYILSLSNK